MRPLARAPHLCLICGSDCVYPVQWYPVGDGESWVRLRCGACDTWREGVFDEQALDDFDRKLAEDERRIAANADRLHRAWRSAEGDAFAAALREGLIDAGDFDC